MTLILELKSEESLKPCLLLMKVKVSCTSEVYYSSLCAAYVALWGIMMELCTNYIESKDGQGGKGGTKTIKTRPSAQKSRVERPVRRFGEPKRL